MSTETVILIMFFGTTLSVVLYGYRYMQNKERMAMIERGIYAAPAKDDPFHIALKIALAAIGGGAGLFLAFLLVNFVFEDLRDTEVVYFSLTVLMAGIGLLAGVKNTKKQ